MKARELEKFLQDAILQLERLEESFEDFNLFEVLGAVHRELQHMPTTPQRVGCYWIQVIEE